MKERGRSIVVAEFAAAVVVVAGGVALAADCLSCMGLVVYDLVATHDVGAGSQVLDPESSAAAARGGRQEVEEDSEGPASWASVVGLDASENVVVCYYCSFVGACSSDTE